MLNVGSHTLSVTFTPTDSANYTSTTRAVTLTVDKAAPTDIALLGNSIRENQPSGALVGTLSSTDADVGDSFTYTLVEDNNASPSAPIL